MLALLRRRQPLRYVFAAASDTDFMPDHVRVAFARDRWLFRYGLRRADAIVAQSEAQRELLRAHYGCQAVRIPNFLDLEPREVPDAQRTEILWVGRLREIKRPRLFVELARRHPDLRFTMIGAPTALDGGLGAAVAEASAAVPNLRFLGFQPPAEVEKHFDRGRVLVSTSSMEGFPNVFLQAMRRGIPIVSFVDPDGTIARHGLGHVVADETDLDAAVRAAATPGAFPPGPIRDYYRANFGPESVVDRYRSLLAGLAASP
jgi:glycosyltransferase involved in cell wall biosynthesis